MAVGGFTGGFGGGSGFGNGGGGNGGGFGGGGAGFTARPRFPQLIPAQPYPAQPYPAPQFMGPPQTPGQPQQGMNPWNNLIQHLANQLYGSPAPGQPNDQLMQMLGVQPAPLIPGTQQGSIPPLPGSTPTPVLGVPPDPRKLKPWKNPRTPRDQNSPGGAGRASRTRQAL